MATSLNASLNVNLNPQSLNASTKQIQQALGRITGQASEFQKSLDASTARVFAFGATTAVLNTVTQSFKKLVSTTIEVEKRLVEINSIFQATETTFNRFRNSIFQVAKDTGQAFGTVADGAAELARQGLSAEETAKRLKASLVLTRISGLDAEKSVKALTAAINGFASAGLSANVIVNKLVAVDTAFAVSAQDLAEAFSRAGSTAEDAGVSFDQLLGLVTAVEQKTARGGAVIGNAFKSIFTRLSRGTTIEELKELGVAIDATQTGIQKLSALSAALERISDPTVSSKIKELAGGVFQINVVSAALKDLSSETSIFKGAAVTAANATNEAFAKNADLNKTISAQINSLVQGLTSLSEKIGTITFGPLIENLVGIASKFTEFLDKALDPEKGNTFVKGLFKAIGSFLSGPAVVIFTAAFVKIFKLVAKFAGEGLKALFTVGTQTERIKQIEGGIVGLLQRDVSLRKTITSSTATQVQKEQAVIQAIQRENALLQQQATLMRSLAAAAASRGVSGVSASGTFTRGRKGMAFATGFRQEEAMARMLGAPSNVKAHKGKGKIGGEDFIMNDHEIEMVNLAGGDSAVLPLYAGGNMPRYAAGYTLNYLKGLTPKQRESAMKTNKFKESPRSVQEGAALLGGGSKKMENVVSINPQNPSTAMLIPNIGASTSIPAGTRGRFKFGGKHMGFEYSRGLAVQGPKVPRAVDQAADPHDEKLRKNITRSVTTNASNFAGLLKPVLGKPSPAKILQKLKRQGGGKGALKGIVGAAFEASVNAALDISPARRVEGGDFDVKNPEPKKGAAIRTLFGVKNKSTNIFDYKENARSNSAASFAKKIANEDKLKGRLKTVQRPKRLGSNFAGGYMPKFAKGTTSKSGAVSKLPETIEKTEGAMGGLMMGLFALQGVMGMVTMGHQENLNSIESEAEERINLAKETGKSYEAIRKNITSIKEEAAERKSQKPKMVSFIEATEKATAALLTLATINMLTGGGLGKAGKGMGNFIMGKGKGGGFKGLRPDGKRAFTGANAKKGLGMAGKGLKAGGAMLGRAALPLALLFGAVDIGSTLMDKSLNKDQKDERVKKKGSVLGAGLAGAGIGAMVGGPIGALVGGAVGTGIAMFATKGESKADKRKEMNQRNIRNIAEGSGRLDFGTTEGFEAAAVENLEKIHKAGGDAFAIQERYDKALEARAQVEQDMLDGTLEGDALIEKRNQIQDELNKAAMQMVGTKFLTIGEEEEHRRKLNAAERDLRMATEKLAKARVKLSKGQVDLNKRTKSQQRTGQLRTKLGIFADGPAGEAVNMASEQNLMMRDVNVASAEKTAAQDALNNAIADGADDSKVAELRRNLIEAGDKIKQKVTEAAVNFAVSMKKAQDALTKSEKEQRLLNEKFQKAATDHILAIVKGEKGTNISGLNPAIKNLRDVFKGAERNEKFRIRQGKGSGFTVQESQDIGAAMAMFKEALKNAGFENTSFNEGLSMLGKDFAKAFFDRQNLDKGNTIQEGLYDRSERNQFTKDFGKNALNKLFQKEGMGDDEAMDALIAEQKLLKAQIAISKQNFKRLNESMPEGEDIAKEISGLAGQLKTASASFDNLKTFSTKISTTVTDTSGLIEKQAEFVESQKGIISDLTKEISILQGRVDKIKTEEE
jgi:TP901 family phage tail tape measure protein